MSKRYPKKINVIAKRDPQSDNGYHFHMEDEAGHELETLVFSKDEEPGMKREDEHEVRFKLEQESGMTLEFAQSPPVALWVAWGDKTDFPECPTTQPSQPDTIFYAEDSSPNSLKAVNKNRDQQFFSFALNFVDPHSSTPTKLITYDPGGENQDGGEGRFAISAAMLTILGIGVLAAAVATYFAFRT